MLAALPVHPGDLEALPLFFEPFVLAVPRDHRLARRPHVGAGDLRASEMVLLEDGHCLRDQALDVCPGGRRQSLHPLQATSLETLRHLVAAGAGYSLLPRLAVTDDRRVHPLLAYRELSERAPGRTIGLVCRRRAARYADIERLAGFHPPALAAGGGGSDDDGDRSTAGEAASGSSLLRGAVKSG